MAAALSTTADGQGGLGPLTAEQRKRARAIAKAYLLGPYKRFDALLLPHFTPRWMPVSAAASVRVADGRRSTPPWPHPTYADPTPAEAIRNQGPRVVMVAEATGERVSEPARMEWVDEYHIAQYEQVNDLLMHRMPSHLARALHECYVHKPREGRAVPRYAEFCRQGERTIYAYLTEGLGTICAMVYGGARWAGGEDDPIDADEDA